LTKVTVQEVIINTVNTGKKPYSQAVVTYTTERGENKEKKIMSFSNPAVFAAVSKIKHPTVVEVENDGAPYYNWTQLSLVAEEAAPKGATPANSVKTVTSTYETAEERKVKQLYIIRQSSITNALTYWNMVNDREGQAFVETDQVLETAQKFVDFVYGNKFDEKVEAVD
jgi:hypothetical protein